MTEPEPGRDEHGRTVTRTRGGPGDADQRLRVNALCVPPSQVDLELAQAADPEFVVISDSVARTLAADCAANSGPLADMAAGDEFDPAAVADELEAPVGHDETHRRLLQRWVAEQTTRDWGV